MMVKAVIPHGHQSNPVHVNADGWPHATEIAARFGREPRDWLRLHELHFWRWVVIQCRNASLTQTGNSRFAQIDTESHMRALARCLDLPFEPKFSGRSWSQGTGGAPDLHDHRWRAAVGRACRMSQHTGSLPGNVQTQMFTAPRTAQQCKRQPHATLH